MKLHAHRHLLGKIIFYPERAGLGVLVTLQRNGAVHRGRPVRRRLAVLRELAFGEADLVDLAVSMDARLAREMEIEDAALTLPDLGAAVKRVVRLLLEHSGDGLTDDVALVRASSRGNVT